MYKKFIKARLVDIGYHDVFICADSIVRMMPVKNGVEVKLGNSEETYIARDLSHTYSIDDINDIANR